MDDSLTEYLYRVLAELFAIVVVAGAIIGGLIVWCYLLR
jgi:hypothetical protein